MSKFTRMIYATGEKRTSFKPELSTVNMTDTWDSCCHDMGTISTYSIRVAFQSNFSVTSLEAVKGDIAVGVNESRRRIVEDVFGEFRQHIRSIEQALWDRDYHAARAALRDLEYSMFEEKMSD